MRIITCFLILILCKITSAQIVEDFTFDIKENWNGSNGGLDFKIENGKLQSNSTLPNSNFYISRPNKIATHAVWEFWVNLKFNTSNSNYVDVYLISNREDLKSSNIQGYFVRIGGTDDEISLYKRNTTLSTSIKIIDGQNGLTNSTNSTLKIQVIRNEEGDFELFVDKTGTGKNYVLQGIASDKTYIQTAFFGIYIQQSTASFHLKHFFDDISIKEIEIDKEAPNILEFKSIDSLTLEVVFTEPINFKSSTTIEIINLLQTFTVVQKNPTTYQLKFLIPPATGNYRLKIKNLDDMAGNTSEELTSLSVFHIKPYVPKSNELSLNEVMVDPTPVLNQPNAEYIEIWNRSNHYLIMDQLKIILPNGTLTFKNDTIPPKNYIVITSLNTKNLFNSYASIVISPNTWLALRNESGFVKLIDTGGRILDEMEYDLNTYKDSKMKDGGYSLELLDPDNICRGNLNWAGSTGSPGKENIIYQQQLREERPNIIEVNLQTSSTIQLKFSIPLDTIMLKNPSHYQINNGAKVRSVSVKADLKTVELTLTEPLRAGIVHQLKVEHIKNCGGSIILENSFDVLHTKKIEANDLLINEILFNPKPGGVDYLEIYNASGTLLNLSGLIIANGDKNGHPMVKRVIDKNPFYLEPEAYLLLTSEKDKVSNYFKVKTFINFYEFNLPAFALEQGRVFIMNNDEIIDQLQYHQDMHFGLMADPKGVALERVSFLRSTNEPSNFLSASSDAGYGTPGYINSVSKDVEKDIMQLKKEVYNIKTLESVPVRIGYQLKENGWLATLSILNTNGLVIYKPINNQLLGKEGEIFWHGESFNNFKLRQGIYLLQMDLFNLKGQKMKIKKTFVLYGGDK